MNKKLQKRYNDLIETARWALWWECVWPVLWHWIIIAALFASLSWLGLWFLIQGTGRMFAVIGFMVLILFFGVWPFIRMRLPTREAAQNRVERDSGLKHSPAHAVEDNLVLGTSDNASQKLWALHIQKALESVALMKVLAPSPSVHNRDPFAFRYIILLITFISA